jgi:energy-coupling factor transport system substrate-specific component
VLQASSRAGMRDEGRGTRRDGGTRYLDPSPLLVPRPSSLIPLILRSMSVLAKSPLSIFAFALVPRAVALNLALGAIVGALKLPLYLDSVGTMLVGALAGPWAGILTGVTSNIVLGLLSSPTFFAFIPVAIVIGALAGLLGKVGAFRSLGMAVPAGAVIGLAAGLSSVPIVCALFGCVTVSGTGLITIALRALGSPLPVAAAIASMSTDIVDKALSAAIVTLVIVRLPSRISARLQGVST